MRAHSSKAVLAIRAKIARTPTIHKQNQSLLVLILKGVVLVLRRKVGRVAVKVVRVKAKAKAKERKPKKNRRVVHAIVFGTLVCASLDQTALLSTTARLLMLRLERPPCRKA